MTNYQEELKYIKRNNPRIFEIQKKQRKNILLRAFTYEIFAVFILIALRDKLEVLITFAILGCLVIPFLSFKMWKLFERGWIGTIKKADYAQRSTRALKDCKGYSGCNLSKQTVIDFTVIDDSDKVYFFTLEKQYEKAYKLEDTVMSIPGIAYPINLTPHNMCVCTKCGGVMPSTNTHCPSCGTPPTVIQKEITPFE